MGKVWGTVSIPRPAPHSSSLARGEAGEDLVWIKVVLRGVGVATRVLSQGGLSGVLWAGSGSAELTPGASRAQAHF